MGSAEQADTVEIHLASEFEERIARYFGARGPAVHLEFGAQTHPGKVRTNNEDHYGVVRRRRSRDVLLTNVPLHLLPPQTDDAYTIAVADGIGGAAFGELASMFALSDAWDLTGRAFKWHFELTEHEAQELTEQLKVYGQLMHQALLDRAQGDPRLAGMGTTLTGALLVGADAVIAHVGDSRAYLYRNGSLQQLTRDHTMAQKQVDEGIINSVTEAPRFMRHVLMNCLGGRNHELQVDVRHLPLADGDRLLLCTDGLTDMVKTEEIGRTLERCQTPADACQALVEQALDRGGKDNVTVVLAQVAINTNPATPLRQVEASQ